MREIGFWSPKKVMIGAFLLCFLITGIPFWIIPYSNLTLPNSFFGIGIFAVFLVALVLAYRVGFKKGLLVSGMVFPAVLMARVIVEGLMEPGHHNLWPLALIITLVLSIIVAGTGAVLGWLAARLF
jgi:hypothetical protein